MYNYAASPATAFRGGGGGGGGCVCVLVEADLRALILPQLTLIYDTCACININANEQRIPVGASRAKTIVIIFH